MFDSSNWPTGPITITSDAAFRPAGHDRPAVRLCPHAHGGSGPRLFMLAIPRPWQRCRHYRRQVSYQPFIRHMVVEPHLRDLLAHLRPAYTNRHRHQSYQHHGPCARGARIANDVRQGGHRQRRAPMPSPIRTSCSDLLDPTSRIAPSEMIFIGDSELDAAAAHQADVPFMWPSPIPN
jgi:hypothetical protein